MEAWYILDISLIYPWCIVDISIKYANDMSRIF